MRSERKRRSANTSALADEESTHWMSSTARTSGRFSASIWKHVRTATARARGSSSYSGARSMSSAPSSARRRGAESVGSTSSTTPSRRSASTTCGSPRSASAGRDESTRNPRCSALASPAAQSVDFPTPASPSSTRPLTPRSMPSRKALTESSSSSLPRISLVITTNRDRAAAELRRRAGRPTIGPMMRRATHERFPSTAHLASMERSRLSAHTRFEFKAPIPGGNHGEHAYTTGVASNRYALDG